MLEGALEAGDEAEIGLQLGLFGQVLRVLVARISALDLDDGGDVRERVTAGGETLGEVSASVGSQAYSAMTSRARDESAIPENILERLEESIDIGDVSRIEALIREASAHDAEVASCLSSLADDLNHDDMLKYIQSLRQAGESRNRRPGAMSRRWQPCDG